MVYSTCSIDPQENERVVETVLERFPWLSLLNVNREEMFPGLKTRPGMTELTESCVRVWNDENDGSGFFIAVFTQTEIEHDAARATRAQLDDARLAALFEAYGAEPTHVAARFEW